MINDAAQRDGQSYLAQLAKAPTMKDRMRSGLSWSNGRFTLFLKTVLDFLH